MTGVGWLPAPAEELFGAEATAEESYEVLTVDVPPASWIPALEAARDRLGCTYFDWLSAVDEPGTGFRVSAHVVALSPVRRLLVRTTVPHEAPALPTAVDVYAGAAWHERETHEMFGIAFEGHPSLDHLLLPEGFEGHPLRKDFVLAARVAKAWPGAKEPGESEHGGPKRRQMLPPGVPDPNEWGPLKGQLPPAPARPTRGAGRAAPGERPTRTAGERPTRAAADRPVRRARTAAEGSASQTAVTSEQGTTGEATASPAEGATGQPAASPAETVASPAGQTEASSGSAGAAAEPRRSRTAAEGSASQTSASPAEAVAGQAEALESAGTPAEPRRSRTAAKGSASQTETPQATDTPTSDAPAADAPAPEAPVARRRARTASDGSASQRAAAPGTAASAGEAEGTPAKAPTAPRSPDAPWHHARPAFDEPKADRGGAEPEPAQASETDPGPEAEPGAQPGAETEQVPTPERAPKPDPKQPGTQPQPKPVDPEDPEAPAGGPQ